MRLPLSKVYRAFPELDRFDDAACAKFLREAKRTRKRSLIALRLLWPPVYVGLLFVSGFVWAAVFGGLTSLVTSDPFSRTAMALTVIQVLLTFAVPALVLLRVRDRWLRWAMKAKIHSTACTCGYSLLGLEIDSGAVQCPECGDQIKLSDRGLTPEMLLAGEIREDR